jgi:hypothetical protein
VLHAQFAFSAALHPGEVAAGSYRTLSGQPRLSSGGFSLGLQVRVSQRIVGDLEAALGLAVAARARFVDVAGWGEADGAVQLGAALAPILNLQYPIWKVNDLGTRTLVTLDGSPEWRFWSNPRVNAPANAAAAEASLRQALSSNDMAVRLNLGVRFEL